MSILFKVEEHLSVKEALADRSNRCVTKKVFEAMRLQLLMLSGLMWIGRVKNVSIRFKADGKEYAYSGNEPELKMKELVLASVDVKEVELDLSYEQVRPQTRLEPDTILEVFASTKIENLSNMYFTRWEQQGENGEVTRFAYGKKDNQLHFGIVTTE